MAPSSTDQSVLPTEKVPPLLKIPAELLTAIAENLSRKEMCKLMLSCKRMELVCRGTLRVSTCLGSIKFPLVDLRNSGTPESTLIVPVSDESTLRIPSKAVQDLYDQIFKVYEDDGSGSERTVLDLSVPKQSCDTSKLPTYSLIANMNENTAGQSKLKCFLKKIQCVRFLHHAQRIETTNKSWGTSNEAFVKLFMDNLNGMKTDIFHNYDRAGNTITVAQGKYDPRDTLLWDYPSDTVYIDFRNEFMGFVTVGKAFNFAAANVAVFLGEKPESAFTILQTFAYADRRKFLPTYFSDPQRPDLRLLSSRELETPDADALAQTMARMTDDCTQNLSVILLNADQSTIVNLKSFVEKKLISWTGLWGTNYGARMDRLTIDTVKPGSKDEMAFLMRDFTPMEQKRKVHLTSTGHSNYI